MNQRMLSVALKILSGCLVLLRGHAESQRTTLQNDATKLLNELLDGYDNRKRPGFGGPPTVIRADLNIRSMGPISEADMTYSMDTYFRQTWDDERLKFNRSQQEMAVHIKMLQKIWKPDTYFLNGMGSYLHMITEPNKLLRIMRNGTILYSMRLTIKASCPMYLHYFPVDEQSCPLQFGSYALTTDQVVYVWKFGQASSIQISKDMRLSQFDLIDTPAWNETIRTSFGEFSTLRVTFRLSRHMGYFLIQVYVPCILIVVLSWVSFWLNREATADRVGLGITTVLTLTTTSMDTRDDLPKVHYATALDWFVIMCFGFVIGTLLQFAGVHYFTKIGSGEFEDSSEDDDLETIPEDEEPSDDLSMCPQQPSKPMNIITEPVVSQFPNSDNSDNERPTEHQMVTMQGLSIPSYIYSAQNGRQCGVTKDSFVTRLFKCLQGNAKYRRMMRRTASATGVNSVSMIDKVSRILFPLTFLLLNLVYWIGYTSQSPDHNALSRVPRAH